MPAPSVQTATGRRRFGTFDFDLRTLELKRDGQAVKLPPQPARVLALLLSRPGEVVLREELKSHLWGGDTFVDFERGLNFCILQVRTALGDTSDNPRFVQTVPRRGYRFIAPVADAGDSTPVFLASPAAPFAPGPAEVPARRAFVSRPGWLWLSAAALVLAPLAWLVWASRPVVPSTAGVGGPGARVRIAVLPFANLSGDAQADYVADGLTVELIAALGRVSPQRLGVIARTSSMAYRDTRKTVAEIGRELGVQYVVEGSVRRDGGRLRVASNLVSTADQTQLWADSFERPAGDAMTLDADLAARIARVLALELVPLAASRGLPAPARDPEAWDGYLRGRQLMARGAPDDVARAVEEFEAVVAQDPGFAAGWAQLAETRHVQVMMGVAAPMEAYPRVAEAARRAMALDRNLPDAHLVKGLAELWFDWTPRAAAQSFERALALNGSHAAAHHDYAWALVALGRFDEALAHITTARDLDPLSPRATNDIGWLHLHLRRPADAARACQHTLTFEPRSLEAQACLERAFAGRGLFAEALEAARATVPRDAVNTAGVGNGQPATGSRQPAVDGGAALNPAEELKRIWEWRLQRLEAASRTRWISPYQIAAYQVMLGKPDEALRRLEEAVEQRAGMMVFLATDPVMDPLRAQPRFEAVLRKVTSTTR
jgi:TolB-like protein/DNA-binding winged helix-turn-helix (wHTH) protein